MPISDLVIYKPDCIRFILLLLSRKCLTLTICVEMTFEIDNLPYAYDALEPYIDEQTMRLHHDKHYAGYTNKLNSAIEGTALAGQSIVDIFSDLDMDQAAVRNNGGGYYNHSLFWKVMGPGKGGEPTGALRGAIDRAFGSFRGFRGEFSQAAATRFGSGWAWLCVRNGGALCICSTPNQDNPLMPGGCEGMPILGLDVWEHSYYLKYQNRRLEYIENFFNVINWDCVSQLYEENKQA